ncbi:MAG: ATP-binding cassette domain-containing protein [Spirochaetia bacterium]
MRYFSLEVENIYAGFPEKAVLEGISFTKTGPGLTMVLGENGVGKSLLLRSLAGITLPSRGQVSLRIGKRYYNTGLDAQSRNHIGYQSEYLAYWREYSILQILQLVASIKLPNEKPTVVAEKAVQQFHLEKEAKTRLRRLSFGFQRRVSLALSMINTPQVLLLDEPTNGLDPAETDFFLKHIKKISEDSCVLVASHRLEEMIDLQAAALLLVKGKLAYNGSCPTNPKAWYHEQHAHV